MRPLEIPTKLVLSLSLLLAAMFPPPARAEEPSEARLPLAELLALHEKLAEADRKPPEPRPPVAAAIHRLDLEGRLLDAAVDLTARFEVAVLDDDAWVELPLLEHGAGTHLSELPEVPGAAFVVDDGRLTFVTRKRGVFKFELALIRRATVEGRRRTLRLVPGDATLARMRLTFDEGMFRLTSDGVVEATAGHLVFPRDGAFQLEWERTGEAPDRRAEAVRPEIESVIPVAHASTVSTLEGARITRLRYELRFAGNKPIALGLPSGSRVERAYLNGTGIPFEVEDGRLALEVSPAREGDQSGVLELVLRQTGDAFHLSGAIDIELPHVSWPVHQLYLNAHLPQVFNYGWSGGSLSPGKSPQPVRYTYDIPLPGKHLTFHQSLITASSPNVTLDYAVDLDGHYYRP